MELVLGNGSYLSYRTVSMHCGLQHEIGKCSIVSLYTLRAGAHRRDKRAATLLAWRLSSCIDLEEEEEATERR